MGHSTFCLGLVFAAQLSGYSVLTHEAIIDTAWNSNLKPMLLTRYPRLAPDELVKLHAFAYGGAIIQDMGYYPFGNQLFSDLTHYVRSADFVTALLDEARNAEEYAFAMGALAHYSADTWGHSMAVNRSVALLYPKLRARFGNTVTYADNTDAHMKVEFGFDVIQVAHGNYASKAYHDFVGFEVSKPVLERAFKKTYGVELSDLFTSLDLALGSYRHAAGTLIPEMTRVAWETKKDEIEKLSPGVTAKRFRYRFSRSKYEKEWGRQYQRPGILARILAFLMKLLPRVGPLRALSFKLPTPETERLFVASFGKTLAQYRSNLRAFERGQLKIANRDLDTGRLPRAGEYRLADSAYAQILTRIPKDQLAAMPEGLRRSILAFFGEGTPKRPAKVKKNEWAAAMAALGALRGAAHSN